MNHIDSANGVNECISHISRVLNKVWGHNLFCIYLVTITFLHTTPSEAGRVLPVNSKSFMKRVGPFFNERRVYNHPYIEDHHVRVRPFFALHCKVIIGRNPI